MFLLGRKVSNETAIMPRALGGAPASRVIPLGLPGGRPRWAPALASRLLANAKRVRRVACVWQSLRHQQCQPQRPRFSQPSTLKNKFFRKEARPRSACDTKNNLWMALCPASCVQCFKTKAWGGARPPPRAPPSAIFSKNCRNF